MNYQTVSVNLGDRSYDIQITSGAMSALGRFARQRCQGLLAIIITDENVRPHADAARESLTEVGFQCQIQSIPPGESQKCLEQVEQMYDFLAEIPADRQTLVTALGGGVIGDLAGFVAATFTRGLPLLMAPTTLLAMVDSSVGGKVGINHSSAKNLIGSFYQPVGVWIDTSSLNTLPDREYRSGLAEVVKYGVILDPDFFVYLETHVEQLLNRDPETLRQVIARCCRLKADIVERDEREQSGLRAVLNYGHTFGHAFEAAAGYGTWLHGEAVAAGMVCACQLAEKMGLIPRELPQRQLALLKKLRLPAAPEHWSLENILNAMRRDKKAKAGKLRFVLPKRLGAAALFDDISEQDVRAVLDEIWSEN
jgi:3-dehydroquinate synthase